MDLRKVSQANDAIVIDTVNVDQIKSCAFFLDVPIHWHKFLIEDVYGLRRNVVLKIILESIKPLELIPLSYTQNGKGVFFFARICKPAIEKLCRDKLIIQNPHNAEKPFKFKIILKYTNTGIAKVDMSENVLCVLQKRYKSQILCLNNFCEDTDLADLFLLSQPRLLAFVLNVAKSLKPKVIKLCNNEIRTLDAFKIMSSDGIVSLDLRNNLIKDLAELNYLENLNLTELWLEGNPLCELYDEYNYVQQVIKYCPKVEKLDGFLLRQNGVPSFRRNFLCDMSSYDVVSKFLECYFPTYDGKNFMKLESFYHKDATFSMTAEFYKKQMSSNTAQLKSYKLYSRNLLNSCNTGKNLFIGSNSIMKLFNVLPRSEHDPCSFTVDVLQYTNKCAVVVVTGVFREVPNIERLLGFNRYFFLERRNDEYRIANEQMHVFNALTSQEVTAFKKSHILHEAKNSVQQKQMINTFALLTNLTKEWAKLFLEECHYNLKHATVLFVDLYKNDKIPPGSFKN